MTAKSRSTSQDAREYSRDKPFRWTPGDGPRASALMWLELSYLKPRAAMGEAWFMGGQHIYDELLDPNFDGYGHTVESYLYEIASGTRSFGPIDSDWKLWFHYFLAQNVSRRSLNEKQFSFVSIYVTTFVTQYPADAPATLRDAALDTLGRWVCAPFLWQENDLRLRSSTAENDEPLLGFDDNQVNRAFSASLFFCWKYLPSQEIESWVESLFAIRGAWWRAQFLLWLVGAHPFVIGEKTQPSQFGWEQPEISWEESDLLCGSYDGEHGQPNYIPFISNENRAAMQSALRKHVTQKLFFDWLDCFASTRDVENELGDWPLRFAESYLD